jgi:hypothetical protein
MLRSLLDGALEPLQRPEAELLGPVRAIAPDQVEHPAAVRPTLDVAG